MFFPGKEYLPNRTKKFINWKKLPDCIERRRIPGVTGGNVNWLNRPVELGIIESGVQTTQTQFSPPKEFDWRVLQFGSSHHWPSTKIRYSWRPGGNATTAFHEPSLLFFNATGDCSQLV